MAPVPEYEREPVDESIEKKEGSGVVSVEKAL
jgi:hypothetical protein